MQLILILILMLVSLVVLMPLPKDSACASLLRIHDILADLSAHPPPSPSSPSPAAANYPAFRSFAEHIAKLFSEDRLYDVLPRLRLEIEIVRKYDPPVRPALDPYVSMQIGVFSRNFADYEVGHFLNYPDCCIRSFAEDVRYGLDSAHSEELTESGREILVTVAGFVPCSISCGEAHRRGLIAFAGEEEVTKISLLERELSAALPHFHSEYQGHYFEVMRNRSGRLSSRLP